MTMKLTILTSQPKEGIAMNTPPYAVAEQPSARRIARTLSILSTLLVFSSSGVGQVARVNVPTGIPVGFVESLPSDIPGVIFQGTSLGGSSIFLTRRGAGLILTENETAPSVLATQQFLNVQSHGTPPFGLDPMGPITHYLYGGPPTWQTHLQTYERVDYGPLYPGITVQCRADARRLKYGFEVQPGATADRIAWNYPGSTGLALDPRTGQLKIAFASREGGERTLIAEPPTVQQPGLSPSAAYQLRNDEVQISIDGEDPNSPLTIEVLLVYDDYFEDYDLVPDSAEEVFVIGGTASPFLALDSIQEDLFIAKIDSTQSRLLQATFLGGSGDDVGHGGVLGRDGSLYATGATTSPDLPISSSIKGWSGDRDGFVLRLSNDGASLISGTYFGDIGVDVGETIVQMEDGSLLVAGLSGPNFPEQNTHLACFTTVFPANANFPRRDYFLLGLDEQITGQAFSVVYQGAVLGSPLSARFENQKILLGLDLLDSDTEAIICYNMSEFTQNYNNSTTHLPQNGYGFFALLWKYYNNTNSHTYNASAASSTGKVPLQINTQSPFLDAADLDCLEETNPSVFSPTDPSGSWQAEVFSNGIDRLIAPIFWIHRWKTPVFTETFGGTVGIKTICLDSKDPDYPRVEDLCDFSGNSYSSVTCSSSFTAAFQLLEWQVARWPSNGGYDSHDTILWSTSFPFFQSFVYDPPAEEAHLAPYFAEAAHQLRSSIVAPQNVSVVTYDAGKPAGGAVIPATVRLVDLVHKPFIRIESPDGIGDVAQRNFEIRWLADDPDSNAIIDLYYDSDDRGQDGTPIVRNLPEEGSSGRHLWRTHLVPEGQYYIYAVIDDGEHDPVVSYSRGPVKVNHASPHPDSPNDLDRTNVLPIPRAPVRPKH